MMKPNSAVMGTDKASIPIQNPQLLLRQVGVEALQVQAGQNPPKSDMPLGAVCHDEPLPDDNFEVFQEFLGLKANSPQINIEFLRLWLEKFVDEGYQIPPEYLPYALKIYLLPTGTQYRRELYLSRKVIGKRGIWLKKQQNPEQNYEELLALRDKEQTWEYWENSKYYQHLSQENLLQAKLWVFEQMLSSRDFESISEMLFEFDKQLRSLGTISIESILAASQTSKIKYEISLYLSLFYPESIEAELSSIKSYFAFGYMPNAKAVFDLRSKMNWEAEMTASERLKQMLLNGLLLKNFPNLELVSLQYWYECFQIDAKGLIEALFNGKNVQRILPRLIKRAYLEKDIVFAKALIEQSKHSLQGIQRFLENWKDSLLMFKLLSFDDFRKCLEIESSFTDS